jgi:GH24 family phage-related lysozyme (muramidase)
MATAAAASVTAAPLTRPVGAMKISSNGLDFLYRIESYPDVSNHLYWPKGSSGVTLGAGYDMKERTKHSIVHDMMSIGLPKDVAEKIAQGSKLKHSAAQLFAEDNDELVSLTRQQEMQLLRLIVPHYEPIVRRRITVNLTQYQFDALVSFVYNPGGSFLPVAQAINQGDLIRAMGIVKTRNTTGGKVDKGLINRRAKEINLFEHGIYKAHAHHRHHKSH